MFEIPNDFLSLIVFQSWKGLTIRQFRTLKTSCINQYIDLHTIILITILNNPSPIHESSKNKKTTKFFIIV